MDSVVSRETLEGIIAGVLSKYPWMEDYPVHCHLECTRWKIANEYGHDAGDAWREYDSALWLLNGGHAGVYE